MPWYAYIGYAIIFTFMGCIALMIVGIIVAAILYAFCEDRPFFISFCVFLFGVVLLAIAAVNAQ